MTSGHPRRRLRHAEGRRNNPGANTIKTILFTAGLPELSGAARYPMDNTNRGVWKWPSRGKNSLSRQARASFEPPGKSDFGEDDKSNGWPQSGRTDGVAGVSWLAGQVSPTAREFGSGLRLTGPPPVRVVPLMSQIEAWPLVF